jgi:hypothetical protein
MHALRASEDDSLPNQGPRNLEISNIYSLRDKKAKSIYEIYLKSERHEDVADPFLRKLLVLKI